MNIGIYSGSFDPIHIGHAIIAEWIVTQTPVDRLWLMVSKVNPLKTATPPAPDIHRVNMARLVADETPGVEVSEFELTLPPPSYTYRTLCLLSEKYPQHTFHLIIGADNWKNFHKWKHYENIINQYKIIIYPRPGIEIDQNTLPENVEYIDCAPLMSVSSTLLRKLISDKKTPLWLLPPKVADYIDHNNLYSK